MKTQKEIEEKLGRKLSKVELFIFKMNKDNKDYYFDIDKNNQLTSIRK